MRALVAALWWAAALAGAADWRTVYFHDQDQASLELNDIAVGEPNCVVATGVLTTRGKTRPVAVVSTDGGAKWATVNLKGEPQSLQLAGAAHAWLLTENALWTSTDCGATWTRAAKLEDMLAVHFTSPTHGFAVGVGLRLLQTDDGGKSWRKAAVANPPTANPERSAYSTVSFAGGFGFVTGFHQPRRPDDDRLPDWMDPTGAKRRRQWPSLSFFVQSADGGQTWKAESASLLGRVTRVRLASPAAGLILIEFDRSFEYPSEVYRLGADQAGQARFFRDQTLAVTDIALFDDSHGLVAGYASAGLLHQLPIPAKVRIEQTADGGATWAAMSVDYRAVAKRVFLAYSAAGPVFAATDTGMILKWARP